jgi:Fe-S-cluster containining protein
MSDRNGKGVRPTTLELPLLELPSAHPCSGCGDCCSYVAIEIDAPTTNRDYDQIFWYLTHHGVSVYVDWEGDWYAEFQSMCAHLTPQRTCAIYAERPEICSAFSWEECERTTREPAARHLFRGPGEFFAWLERRRPRAWTRFLAYRRELMARRGGGAATPRPRGRASASAPPSACAQPRARARSRP